VEDLQGADDPLDHLADDDAAKGEDVDGSKHNLANAAAGHGGRRDETSLNADKPKILTSEEVMKTVSSKPFSSFINTASKKVERVLGAPILSDLLVDYVGGGASADANKSFVEAKDITNSKYIQSQQTYECAKWTAQRDVTDIDWSPLHRELILTTYHLPSGRGQRGETAVAAISAHDTLSSSVTPRSSELQSDGLALIWSLAMPHRPEHIFTCGSPVTSGRFHPTDPTLIIGGCESGQLVVWDIRSGRLPVQKSALSTVTGANAKGHTHPIASMEIIEGGVRKTNTIVISAVRVAFLTKKSGFYSLASSQLQETVA
jgi:dynein intermediate chain, cytosolic